MLKFLMYMLFIHKENILVHPTSADSPLHPFGFTLQQPDVLLLIPLEKISNSNDIKFCPQRHLLLAKHFLLL